MWLQDWTPPGTALAKRTEHFLGPHQAHETCGSSATWTFRIKNSLMLQIFRLFDKNPSSKERCGRENPVNAGCSEQARGQAGGNFWLLILVG